VKSGRGTATLKIGGELMRAIYQKAGCGS
jgi:hypothetical protein